MSLSAHRSDLHSNQYLNDITKFPICKQRVIVFCQQRGPHLLHFESKKEQRKNDGTNNELKSTSLEVE